MRASVSAKRIVKLCTFASAISFHNRQAELEVRGSLCSTQCSRDTGRDFYTQGLVFLPSAGFSSRTMAQQAPTDPTKMGEGRAIAVLTSGGDAQGK